MKLDSCTVKKLVLHGWYFSSCGPWQRLMTNKKAIEIDQKSFWQAKALSK